MLPIGKKVRYYSNENKVVEPVETTVASTTFASLTEHSSYCVFLNNVLGPVEISTLEAIPDAE